MGPRRHKVKDWTEIDRFSGNAGRGEASTLCLLRAILDRRGLRLATARGQGLQRFLAPFDHGALMADAEAQRQKLAEIGQRRGSVRKALGENPLIAGAAVAVMLQPGQQVV